jgi:hypothetical protein
MAGQGKPQGSSSRRDVGDHRSPAAQSVQSVRPEAVPSGIHRQRQGDPLAHADLENNINYLGVGLVNYIGHGWTEIWAGGLLGSTDALALTNGSRTPVVMAMTCLHGYFQDVHSNSLAEALINATGAGAVAVWASSGLTNSGPQSAMDQALIRAVYRSQPVTLGEAAASAKKAVSGQDVRKTWILFGDPAMKGQMVGGWTRDSPRRHSAA